MVKVLSLLADIGGEEEGSMEKESRFDYTAFHVDALDSEDERFLSKSVNSFTEMGGRLHSVIPKTKKGTTVGYMVVMEFKI